MKCEPWQPIETAPKDGTWVLLTGGISSGDDPCAPCVTAFWMAGWIYAYWDSNWRSEYEKPTHWMPLPEPPTIGGDAEMLKSQLIAKLQESIEKDGDVVLSNVSLIEIFGGQRAVNEYLARDRIVWNIVAAKRKLKAPMESNFFRDIWPEALSALLEKREGSK